jgi:hypothetical protein
VERKKTWTIFIYRNELMLGSAKIHGQYRH